MIKFPNSTAFKKLARENRSSITAYYCGRILEEWKNIFLLPRKENEWTLGLWCLSATTCHCNRDKKASIDVISSWFDSLITTDGDWLRRPTEAPDLMKALGLLFLVKHTGSLRWRVALDSLVLTVLSEAKRASDGCFTYRNTDPYVLVDTLGMVCPPLIAYSVLTNDAKYSKLAVRQLLAFIDRCDPVTHLPPHGYSPDSKFNLGLVGWGRGIGWYLLGLAETLALLPRDNESFDVLLKAFENTAFVLAELQRDDGGWSWYPPLVEERLDSSTTSFVAYALLRIQNMAIGSQDFTQVIDRAFICLEGLVDSQMNVRESSGECVSLGVYSREFGVYSWTQAMTSAFFSLRDCRRDDFR